MGPTSHVAALRHSAAVVELVLGMLRKVMTAVAMAEACLTVTVSAAKAEIVHKTAVV